MVEVDLEWYRKSPRRIATMSTSTTGYTTRHIRPDDYPIWSQLWRSYLEFYSTDLPDSQHEDTFQRLLSTSTYGEPTTSSSSSTSTLTPNPTSTPNFIPGKIYALLLISPSPSSQPIGLAHYLFHPSAWTPSPIAHCYLNDLYVHPGHRGKNLAEMLIREVEGLVRRSTGGGGGSGGCTRLYWLTQPGNVRARKVYDRVCGTTTTTSGDDEDGGSEEGGEEGEGGEEEKKPVKPRTGGLMDRVVYKIDL